MASHPVGIRHEAGDGGGRSADGNGTDWDWIYGRVATALGVLPSAIDEEPSINIFRLLEYWIEEPPAHVILALRYLGERKTKQPKSEQEAFDQLRQFAQLADQPASPLPAHLREMAEWGDAQQAKLKGETHGG